MGLTEGTNGRAHPASFCCQGGGLALLSLCLGWLWMPKCPDITLVEVLGSADAGNQVNVNTEASWL